MKHNNKQSSNGLDVNFAALLEQIVLLEDFSEGEPKKIFFFVTMTIVVGIRHFYGK